jgi:hypothetical protein
MKKWLKRIGLSLIGLILLVTVLVIGDLKLAASRGRAKVKILTAKFDEDEPGWRLQDLADRHNEKLPLDENNGALTVAKGTELIPQKFRDWRFSMFFNNVLEGITNTLPDPDRMAEAREQVETVRDGLALIHASRKFQSGRFPHAIVENDSLKELKSQSELLSHAVFALEWESCLDAIDNKPERALESCRTLLHLRRMIGDEPSLMAQSNRARSVTVAARSLERTLGLTQQTLKKDLPALQSDFESYLSESMNFVRGLESERAQMHERLNHWAATDPTKGTISTDHRAEQLLIRHAARRNINTDHAFILDSLTKRRDAMKLSGKARLDALDAVPGGRSVSQFNFHARFYVTDDIACRHYLRSEALANAIIAAIACERYRLEHNRWPDALSEIPLAILKAVPIDPFSNEPVKLKRTETGIVLYSVGVDKKDNHGNLDPNNTMHSSDYGITLFDPQNRRRILESEEIPKIENDP